jgi:hypothetical protein
MSRGGEVDCDQSGDRREVRGPGAVREPDTAIDGGRQEHTVEN